MRQLILDDIYDLLNSDKVTPDMCSRALNSAIGQYNLDCPRVVSADIGGNGGNTLAVPTEWNGGFSKVCSVEYPVNTVPRSYITANYNRSHGVIDCDVLVDGTAKVEFTIRHICDDFECTIPVESQQPLINLAASHVLIELANGAASAGDNSFGSDGVEQQSEAENYRKMSAQLKRQYVDYIGQYQNTEQQQTVVTQQAAAVVSFSKPRRRILK